MAAPRGQAKQPRCGLKHRCPCGSLGLGLGSGSASSAPSPSCYYTHGSPSSLSLPPQHLSPSAPTAFRHSRLRTHATSPHTRPIHPAGEAALEFLHPRFHRSRRCLLHPVPGARAVRSRYRTPCRLLLWDRLTRGPLSEGARSRACPPSGQRASFCHRRSSSDPRAYLTLDLSLAPGPWLPPQTDR